MTWALDVTGVAALALGCFVALSGAVGILRFPDFYTRIHAAGKNDSLAQILFSIGLIAQTIHYPALGSGAAVRLVLVMMFIFITSPVATHAVTRAAWLDGVKPWRPHE